MHNYYDILGVDRKASFEQLKAAFRQKALQCHPDRGGSHGAMVKINEAWEVLSDPKLRQQHDEQLRTGQANQATFEEARQRSKNYEREWRKFDSWLSSISRDFNSAEFGSKAFFGMEMPTASKSISAWVFLIAGGLIGFLVWLALFVSISQAWAPNETARASSESPFARMKERENSHSYPIIARVVMFTCVLFVATGAWAGKWTHQKFGARISSWLPNEMPFSFFSATPATLDNGRKQSREPKPPPEQTPASTQCPSCEQKLRVPASDKPLSITCPKCETRFDFPNQNNQQERTRMKFPPSKASLATLLRCLLIFEIVFTVILLGIGIFVSTMGEQVLADAGLVTQEEVNMVAFAMFAVALVVLLPLGIASWVGLFQHKNWGRWLYLIGLLFGHLLLVFVGCFNWTYSWDLVAALDSINYLTSGVIVSICFLSPLASEFEQSSITTSS